jgi:hypothetical protein
MRRAMPGACQPQCDRTMRVQCIGDARTDVRTDVRVYSSSVINVSVRTASARRKIDLDFDFVGRGDPGAAATAANRRTTARCAEPRS